MKNEEEKKETSLAIPETSTSIVSVSVANAQRVIEVATGIANELSKVIKSCNLSINLEGKKYILCEGWTTLASLLNLSVKVVDIQERREKETITMQVVRRGKGGQKFVKTVKVRPYTVIAKAQLLKNGEVISEAQAECSNLEKNWCDKEDFAVKSMAQTRAIAKVCRIQLGWIVALTREFETTPAEEIVVDAEEVETTEIEEKASQSPKPIEKTGIEELEIEMKPMPKYDNEESKKIHVLLSKLGIADEQYRKFLKDRYGVSSSKQLALDNQIEIVNTLRKIEVGKLRKEEVFK